MTLEVLLRLLPDDGGLYVELNLTGRLQARQMPALANVASSGGVAGVLMSRQN